MIDAYIALGANLNEPLAQIQRAIEALKQLPNSIWIGHSPLYTTKPMGPQDQPDYINGVACIQTSLSPHQLLDCLQQIELTQGRVRKEERWGPRTLDLDLLLYGQECIQDERLTVPHYGMKERDFVLVPLFDLAPSLTLPDGSLISQLVGQFNAHNLIPVATSY